MDTAPRLVPPWIAPEDRPDLSELAEFSPGLAVLRAQLETHLGCHVAAYRRGARARLMGLCDLYESARLSESQLKRLREAEESVQGAVFVAYAKPLTKRSTLSIRTTRVAGRRIPRFGIGMMRLIGPDAFGWPRDEAASTRALKEAVRLGIRLIDTAGAYGPDVAETLLAKALHPYPSDLVIATKGGLERRSASDWIPDGRPEQLRRTCEKSLRLLRVDALPLYQLHVVDPAVPIEESLGAMCELQHQGKVEHIGLCNVSPSQYLRAKTVSAIASVQNRFNRHDVSHREMVRACEQDQVPFLAWAPLDGGKLVQAESADDALEWILSQSPVLVPIPGVASVDEASHCARIATRGVVPETPTTA